MKRERHANFVIGQSGEGMGVLRAYQIGQETMI